MRNALLSTLEGRPAPSPVPAERVDLGKALVCLRRHVIPRPGAEVSVRCGTCEGCRSLDRWLWSRRIKAESATWPISYWLTLTYGPQHLAKASSKDLVLFRQRLARGWYTRDVEFGPDGLMRHDAKNYLVFRKARSAAQRKALGKCPGDRKMSYLWRFELGENGGRMHAHMLVHTHPELLPPGVFPEAWPHGKVAVTVIDKDRVGGLARYLSKYVGKSAGDGFKKHASVRYGRVLSGVKQ